MKLLPPEDYYLALSKLREVSFNNLFARSVVENHVDGKVYADDTYGPKAFYVIHPYGLSLLYGDVTEAWLKSELKDYLLCRNGVRKEAEWLQIFPPEMENRIDGILGDELDLADVDESPKDSGGIVVKRNRVNFRFNIQKFEQFRSKINLGKYQFSEIDAALFSATAGSVVPKKFWNNASEFTSRGVGFSLWADGQAVAVAFSSFRHDDMLELGMETKPEYRGRGFGGIVSAKLINFCLERGLEPVWACRLGNRGSYSLAIKLGFEPFVCLPYYELRVPVSKPFKQ